MGLSTTHFFPSFSSNEAELATSVCPGEWVGGSFPDLGVLQPRGPTRSPAPTTLFDPAYTFAKRAFA